jgi:hypothetical protein
MSRARRRRLLGFAPVPTSVAASVFGRSDDGAHRRVTAAVVIAGVCCVGFGAWLAKSPPRRTPAAKRAPEMAVELFESTPPAPAPPPPPRPRHAPLAPTARPVAPSERPAAAAPAQAAEVVARETPSDEPVDLTGFSVVTGRGDKYAGGSTTSGGTNARAVTGGTSTTGDGVHGAGATDLSRPVGVPEAEWKDCGWPQEADALGIDEQIVSMRAIARADGSFESGEVVHDPGHGFGAAVLACARRHGFIPALDRGGNPIRARSGIIRFTFTR